MLVIPIDHTWDGEPVRDRAVLALSPTPEALIATWVAPFHADPPPNGPPGPTDRLWEREVVELFLAGPGPAYVEIEVGPHGHHLVLHLADVRRPAATLLPLDVETRRSDRVWAGRAAIPWSWLPPGADRLNAYRIHGPPEARRYLAHGPLPGPAPDFHQPARFPRYALPHPSNPPGDGLPDAAVARALLGADLDTATLTALRARGGLAAWTALGHLAT
jgi:hypothetical protein